MAIGENIKDLCSEKGLTLKELSEKSGIPVNTIYTLTREDPENARNTTLKPLADALEVDVDFLRKTNGVKYFTEDFNPLFYVLLEKYFFKYEKLANGLKVSDILGNSYYIPYEKLDLLEEKIKLVAFNLLLKELENYKEKDG